MTTQEEINLCMSCPLVECVNCLGDPKRYSKLRKKHDEWKELVTLRVRQGHTNQQIAKELDVHPNTVTKLRKEFGLPLGRGGRKPRGRPRKNVSNVLRQSDC